MYRIRFQPKKSKEPIAPDTTDTIDELFTKVAEAESGDKKKVDDARHYIAHLGRDIVECSNLRTIVAPDDEIKAKQRRLLLELERLPMHRAAHGFVRGRDAFSCAQSHVTY